MVDGVLLPHFSKNWEKYSAVTVANIANLIEQRLHHRDIYFNIVLMTIHGSHLYGFETESSDVDIYIVVDFPQPEYAHLNKTYTKQFILENYDGTVNLDINVVGLNRWLQLVNEGAHQACEAFMSPYSYISEHYLPYYTGFVIPAQTVINRFVSTVKHFTYNGFGVSKRMSYEDAVASVGVKRNVKQLRHAARLATHIAELRSSGSFTPAVAETISSTFPDFNTVSFEAMVKWLEVASGVEIFE